MGNKVIQNVVASQMEQAASSSYGDSTENLNAHNHLSTMSLNGVEKYGDEENNPTASVSQLVAAVAGFNVEQQVRAENQLQQVTGGQSEEATASPRQRKLSNNPAAAAQSETGGVTQPPPSLSSTSTTPKKSILATATNFAVSPLKEKLFKLAASVKPSLAPAGVYSTSSSECSESSDLISNSTSGCSSIKTGSSSSQHSLSGGNSSRAAVSSSIAGGDHTASLSNPASLAFESTFESLSSSTSDESDEDDDDDDDEDMVSLTEVKEDTEEQQLTDNSSPRHVVQADKLRQQMRVEQNDIFQARGVSGISNSDIVDEWMNTHNSQASCSDAHKQLVQKDIRRVLTESPAESPAASSSKSLLEPTVIAPLLQSISLSSQQQLAALSADSTAQIQRVRLNSSNMRGGVVAANATQAASSTTASAATSPSFMASSASAIAFNNNNTKFSSDCKMPPRLEYLLDMPPADYETQVLHSWNPDDRSLNIFVKESDPFTLHRHPVAQSTDCIRTKFGYTKGE
jgi:hypothetical protein